MDIQRIISLVKETKGIITNREMAAHVKEKGVADYVTQVDVAVQDFLKKELYILAPDIQFLGEETGLQQKGFIGAIPLSAEPSLFDPPSVQEEQNALQYRYDRLKKKAAKNR